MEAISEDELANEFINYHRVVINQENLLLRQGQKWGLDMMYDLTRTDPFRCWQVSIRIFMLSKDSDVIGQLGHVLSTLLVNNPSSIEFIANDVLQNEQLSLLLGYVVEDELIDAGVWEQVTRLSK